MDFVCDVRGSRRRLRKALTLTAIKPSTPAEVVPAAIIAAVDMHKGHIADSLTLVLILMTVGIAEFRQVPNDQFTTAIYGGVSDHDVRSGKHGRRRPH